MALSPKYQQMKNPLTVSGPKLCHALSVYEKAQLHSTSCRAMEVVFHIGGLHCKPIVIPPGPPWASCSRCFQCVIGRDSQVWNVISNFVFCYWIQYKEKNNIFKLSHKKWCSLRLKQHTHGPPTDCSLMDCSSMKPGKYFCIWQALIWLAEFTYRLGFFFFN